MTIPLRKFVAPEFVYGTDASHLAGQFASTIGASRLFVVTDNVVRHQPWFPEILSALTLEGMQYELFDRITVNPKDHECAEGAEYYLNSGCNLILAIGGGSVIDSAKGIGILATNPGPISLYEGVDEIVHAIPPLLCIPTTAGSAADISQFSIITNTQENYKMAIVSKMLVPDLSLVDPALTLTADRMLTIDTGLDVLAHAIESYVSNAASPFTRLHAVESIRLTLWALPDLARHLGDLALRDAMMQASLQAGLSFSNASLGLIHAIAHGLGGRFGLIHGELNGMLLPAVVGYNYPAAAPEFDDITRLFEEMPGYAAGTLEQYLIQFIESIRPNRFLTELGVAPDDFAKLIPWILNDPCVVTNPAAVTAEGVMAIYERIR